MIPAKNCKYVSISKWILTVQNNANNPLRYHLYKQNTYVTTIVCNWKG